MPNIVLVNVSEQVAPSPNTLQQTGGLISQGATTLAQGAYYLLTQPSDLTPILTGLGSIASPASSNLTWSAGTVTALTSAPHGFTISDTLSLVISGVTPPTSGYNGTFTVTITGASSFTYSLVSNPGTAAGAPKYIVADSAQLQAMATTYFAQGFQQAVYVLELGPGNATDGVAYLTSWLIANPNVFYAFLVPREWDANSAFLTLLQSYQNLNAKLYFWVTTTTGTYTNYTALMKDVVSLIEAPTVIPTAEFSLAAEFYNLLKQDPSATNKVTPFAYDFTFGTTPYPTKGNNSLLTTIQNNFTNVIGTGAEGGIANTIFEWGTTEDGNDIQEWYSIDWMQITCDEFLANAVINGSNNPVNPLYYDQTGINRLQGVLSQVVTNAVTFGLAVNGPKLLSLDGPALTQVLDLGTYNGFSIINAVPFVAYTNENPGDYKIGKYAGFSIIYTPQRGFKNIVLNLVANFFPNATGA